jgi:hypothetical protein
MSKGQYRVLRANTYGGELRRVGTIILVEEEEAARWVKGGILERLHPGGRGKKNLDKTGQKKAT